jgi:hypothetical protein
MQKPKQIWLSQHFGNSGGVSTEDARGASCEHILYHIPSLSLCFYGCVPVVMAETNTATIC